MILLPYKAGSVSARNLAEALGCRRISLTRSSIHRQQPKVIVNWGNGGNNLPPDELGTQHRILNPIGCVSDAANKLSAFRVMSDAGVTTVPFTTSQAEAIRWSMDETKAVVVRHRLTGHSGEGIKIVEPRLPSAMPAAPLYTKYIPKTDEYRIHVAGGTVFDVQRKARRTDTPDSEVNWRVRNHSNGFIFARDGVNPPQDVLNQARNAITALGLDFGAVDVIWNGTHNRAYVLEVNTACGLEGTTLDKYTQAIRGLVEPNVDVPAWQPIEDTQSEEIEPLQEDVVQSNTSSVYIIVFRTLPDMDAGVFSTREDAENAIPSSVFYNIAQDNNETLEIREVEYHA